MGNIQGPGGPTEVGGPCPRPRWSMSEAQVGQSKAQMSLWMEPIWVHLYLWPYLGPIWGVGGMGEATKFAASRQGGTGVILKCAWFLRVRFSGSS